ncbi:MAG TPA: isopentenyl-diphosphate Delta-isomerase [Alphaproteobacteria bacterium]|nr:isopentenyl-diphosphate Delta-isomerase [Alphaproteobacteria bacterium]
MPDSSSKKYDEIAPFPTVILVSPQDEVLGVCEKIKAHEQGLLHRAFSVFILRTINGKIEALLQQRALNKYHSGGLWTNTCCSHPQPEKDLKEEAKRCLEYEVGLKNIDLLDLGFFTYHASFENALSEHELDHVFVGFYEGNQTIVHNTHEIMDLKWISIEKIELDLKLTSLKYTAWFKGAFDLLFPYLQKIR